VPVPAATSFVVRRANDVPEYKEITNSRAKAAVNTGMRGKFDVPKNKGGNIEQQAEKIEKAQEESQDYGILSADDRAVLIKANLNAQSISLESINQLIDVLGKLKDKKLVNS
jgi:hypothetical protein